jgi:dTDP-3-amino-3,4,6-trideoxy-alpha-D-glucose transaminase
MSSNFRVPRARVHETHRALLDELLAAVEPLLTGSVADEGWGARRTFERRFAEVVGRRHAVGVHSGTIGLLLALRACGVGPGDEVITVANSDISTTGAVSLCGATPVLCDVRLSDYTLDPQRVEALIGPRTRALLPVDLHGHPAYVRALREIADRHGLRIVEDAALAAGARDHGQPVGSFADAAVFSFAPLKPLGSLGSAAAVVTDDPEVADRLAMLSHYGHDPDQPGDGTQRYLLEGYNVPLDPLQAAILSVKLPHLPAWTERRRAAARFYADGLAGTAAIVPSLRPESEPTFRSYTIRVPDQRAAYEGMRAAGVEVVLHYAPPISRYPVYADGLPGADALPVSERLANELLSLPIAIEYDDDDLAYVVETLRPFVALE